MDIVANKLKVSELSASSITIDGFDIQTYFENKLSTAVNFKGTFKSKDDAEKKNGNIIIVGTKEYIYSDLSSDWVEIGDENMLQGFATSVDVSAIASSYADPLATSAEVSTIVEDYTSQMATSSEVSNIASDYVDPMTTSAEVSAIANDYLNSITAIIDDLKYKVAYLQKAISVGEIVRVEDQTIFNEVAGIQYLAEDIEVDTVQSIEPKIGETYTLDLNGCAIVVEHLSSSTKVANDNVVCIRNGATTTINDSTGTGIISGGDDCYGALKITKKNDLSTAGTAILVVNGGTFVGKYAAICGNGNRGNTNITINGGTFTATDPEAVATIFHPQAGTMTINDGTFTGNMCLYQKSGNITINGGKFHSNGVSAEYVNSGNGSNSTGDCIVVETCGYPGGSPTLKITDGEFTSDNASPVASYAKTNYTRLTKFIYGGRFNKQLDSELIADGCEQVEEDGWYVVKTK